MRGGKEMKYKLEINLPDGLDANGRMVFRHMIFTWDSWKEAQDWAHYLVRDSAKRFPDFSAVLEFTVSKTRTERIYHN
jgi:hypothetical protein